MRIGPSSGDMNLKTGSVPGSRSESPKGQSGSKHWRSGPQVAGGSVNTESCTMEAQINRKRDIEVFGICKKHKFQFY